MIMVHTVVMTHLMTAVTHKMCQSRKQPHLFLRKQPHLFLRKQLHLFLRKQPPLFLQKQPRLSLRKQSPLFLRKVQHRLAQQLLFFKKDLFPKENQHQTAFLSRKVHHQWKKARLCLSFDPRLSSKQSLHLLSLARLLIAPKLWNQSANRAPNNWKVKLPPKQPILLKRKNNRNNSSKQAVIMWRMYLKRIKWLELIR